MGMRLKAAALAAVAVVLLSAGWASQAGATQLIEFESAAAVAANGEIPAVPAKPLEEAKEVCGSSTVGWGSELLTTAPSEIKVPNEWGDIVPGKEVMVAGTIHNVSSPGDADIPIDHPFSADTTFDVNLDEPYWNLARELTSEEEGHPSKHELHMELETGAFPHAMPQRSGPISGEPWDLLEGEVKEREENAEPTATLLQDASIGLESGYIPHEGDRVAMRGRWIIDCGHTDFHGELHPLTFMAFGHQEGAKTVVHVLANGYRVPQLYGPPTSDINTAPTGKTFPAGFEEAVTKFVQSSVINSGPTHLALVGELEKTLPSTAPVKICVPEGGSGSLKAKYSFVKRGGAKVQVKAPMKSRCATLTGTIEPEKYKALQPRLRSCDMPWPWLSDRIAESLGIEGLKNSEIERIYVQATGGTFTITYGSETTAPIAYPATAAAVQEALNNLGAIEPGDITVLGSTGGPYTLLFGGKLAEQSITPVTTDRSGLTGGKKLASVIVLRPGGELELRRFVLALIEQKAKIQLEEAGQFAAIKRIESNIQLNPGTTCFDPLSAPVPNPEKHLSLNNKQPFPYYGEITVEL